MNTSNNSNLIKSDSNKIKKMKINRTVTQIMQNCKVDSVRLKKYSDSSLLPSSTEHCPPLNPGFGQTRSILALNTAFEINARGYNVFAAGGQGLGKRTFITQYLVNKGHKQTPIKDWIYVYNFNNPNQPLAIALNSGEAKELRGEIVKIWHNLQLTLSRQIGTECENHSKLISHNKRTNNNKLSNLLNLTPSNEPNSTTDKIQKAAEKTVNFLFKPLLKNYSNNPRLVSYLQLMQQDLINHSALIVKAEDSNFIPQVGKVLPDRYDLNLISSHAEKPALDYGLKQTLHYTPDGAPIVFVPNPTSSNIFGKINQTLQAGYAVSNHMMIKPGRLHQANGGYLILEASHINEYPEAWHGLKLALRTSNLSPIESGQDGTLGDNLLKPEAIPMETKIILLGEAELYDRFAEEDEEFLSLFKIRADFHEEVTRSIENEIAMVSKMADIIAKYDLRHFDSSAQARVLECLSLQCEDQNKLSLHSDTLIQIMLEANRLAKLANAQVVNSEQVHQALRDINYRSSYLKELYLQEITDGQQLINTTGCAVGQINALTVIDYADTDFGMPALLTAVVQHSVGSGDILDIERDVELGGSLHAKGMLIMNSYLRALFSPYHPLNFTASLAFEQSYAHIDGDSATLAEACALLSALADTPISQELGITGSMNQLGRVQAVGGINAKVAGFFDACSHQGLTGNQGVILPQANISRLMLRDDIIEAVKANQFHIYGVNSLSEALTILAKIPVDEINKKGRYRRSSLFGKIIKNLKKWEDQLNPPEEYIEPELYKELAAKNDAVKQQNSDAVPKN